LKKVELGKKESIFLLLFYGEGPIDWRIKAVFDKLVKFVYKLGKNWQTRAWDPVFKTAGFAPDAAMILGLFSQTLLINLRIVINNMVVVFIRKNCIRMVFVCFAFWGLQQK
jgi:hypothetical protein